MTDPAALTASVLVGFVTQEMEDITLTKAIEERFEGENASREEVLALSSK